MIPLNIPTSVGSEGENIAELLANPSYQNEKVFTRKCLDWFHDLFKRKHLFLTKSCTQSLEFAALLLNIKEGDEIILPSYIYVSAANAFVLRGAVPVFIDIRPDNMNINEDLIEPAITEKTKAIVVMHYAGVGCNMKKIKEIAARYNLIVVEDAAHGIMAKYEGEYLGSIGDLGCLSFDQIKNISCGQGGLFIINNENLQDRADIIYENGTNKGKFLKGMLPFYSWKYIGSNFQISELQAAYLYAQLKNADLITEKRKQSWKKYYEHLKPLAAKNLITLPQVPENTCHNAHVFFLRTKDQKVRNELMSYLEKQDIATVFHYIPLHSTDFGKKVGRFSGTDTYTTKESEKLLRLPLYYNIEDKDIQFVIEHIYRFFEIPLQ